MKKSKELKIKTAKIEVSLRAVDSIYWRTKQPKGRKHPSDYDHSLEKQGYEKFARCPVNEFKPDLAKLKYKNIKNIQKIINNLDGSELRILTFCLAANDKLQTHGFTFGQRVYVNLSYPHSEYLDNYYTAYMLMYEDSVEGVHYFFITGSLDDINGSLMLMPKDSILNDSQWHKKQSKLIASKKIQNPKPVRFKPPHRDSVSISLEVPTIDDIKDDLEDEENPTTNTKKTKSNKLKQNSKSTNKFVIT